MLGSKRTALFGLMLVGILAVVGLSLALAGPPAAVAPAGDGPAADTGAFGGSDAVAMSSAGGAAGDDDDGLGDDGPEDEGDEAEADEWASLEREDDDRGAW